MLSMWVGVVGLVAGPSVQRQVPLVAVASPPTRPALNSSTCTFPSHSARQAIAPLRHAACCGPATDPRAHELKNSQNECTFAHATAVKEPRLLADDPSNLLRGLEALSTTFGLDPEVLLFVRFVQLLFSFGLYSFLFDLYCFLLGLYNSFLLCSSAFLWVCTTALFVWLVLLPVGLYTVLL